MLHLLDLPVELLEEIFSYSAVPDLKHLSCCNKAVKGIVKKRLWRHVKIRWISLLSVDWKSSVNKKQLENLRYAKTIQFFDASRDVDNGNYDPGSDDFCSLLKCEWNMTDVKEILANYEKVLTCCDPERLETFSSSRGGYIVCHACHFLSGLKKLDLSFVTNLLSAMYEHLEISADPFVEISKLNFLLELNLSHTDIRDEALCSLSNGVKMLKLLDLTSCRGVSDRGVSYIKKFTQLEELHLLHCHVTDSCISDICTLSSLRTLNLALTDITDVGLKELRKLQFLLRLSINEIGQLTDVGMMYLSSMSSLKKLKIGYTPNVTDNGILYLCQLCDLRELGISECARVTDAALYHLHQLKSLEFLDISHNYQFTNAGLRYLSALTSLKRLMCGDSKTYAAALDALDGKIEIERSRFW